MKKNAGFTLVELIVVIAILAILAGVAIPVYSNYISKANEAADLTMLDSIKTAVVFAATEKQVPSSATITSIEVTAANGEISNITYVLSEDSGATLTHATFAEITAYTGTLNKLQSDTFKGGATWASTGTNADKWVKK